MEESERSKNTVDNQLELMEKSLQMASRYIPGFSGSGVTTAASPFGNTAAFSETSDTEESNMPERTTVFPVESVQEQAVTVLLGGLTLAFAASILTTVNAQEDVQFNLTSGDLYQGYTRPITYNRMIPPYALEVTFSKTVHLIFTAAVRYLDLGSSDLLTGKADGAESASP